MLASSRSRWNLKLTQSITQASKSAPVIHPILRPGNCCKRGDPDCALQHGKKLLNSRFFLLRQFTLAAEEPRIELGREQRVLESLDHPVDDRDHHLNVEVVAKLAAFQAEAHETDRAIRVFADQEAIDLTLENQVGAVVP